MANEVKVRKNWLKAVYIGTIAVAGLSGLLAVLAPELWRSLNSWPAVEPLTFGITGSVYLAFALLSIFGLREPLKFCPVLLLQLFYKVIWLVGVLIPLAISGKVGAYVVAVVIIFVAFVIADLIAIPFAYLFKKTT